MQQKFFTMRRVAIPLALAGYAAAQLDMPTSTTSLENGDELLQPRTDNI